MNDASRYFDLVGLRSRRQALASWKAWAFAAALGSIGLSLNVTHAEWPGRTPLRTSAKTSSATKAPSARNGFQETVERLMMESRMYAERGDHDRAVQLADRAAKISDASRDMLGSAPHCSPVETARFAREVRMKRDQIAGRSKLPLQQYGFAEGSNNESVRSQSAQPPLSAGSQSLVRIEDRLPAKPFAQAEVAQQSRPVAVKSPEADDFASTIPSPSLNNSIPSGGLFDDFDDVVPVPIPEPELPPSPMTDDLDMIEFVASTSPTRRSVRQIESVQSDDQHDLFSDEDTKPTTVSRVPNVQVETTPSKSFDLMDEDNIVAITDERSGLFPSNDSVDDAPAKPVSVVETAPGKPTVRFATEHSDTGLPSSLRHSRTRVSQLNNTDASTENRDGSSHFGIRLVSDSQLDQQGTAATDSFPVQRVRELKRRLESAAALNPGLPYSMPRKSLVTIDEEFSSEPVPLKRSLREEDFAEEPAAPRFVIPSDPDSESSLDDREPVISGLIDDEVLGDNESSSTNDLLLDFRPDEESDPVSRTASLRNIQSEDMVFEEPMDGSELPARTEIEFAPSMAEQAPATRRPSRNVVVARSTIRTINSTRSIVPILSDDSGWKSASDYAQEVASRNSQLVEPQRDTPSAMALTADVDSETKTDAEEQSGDDSAKPRWLNLRGGRVALRRHDPRQPNVANEGLSISTWGHGAAKSRVELWRSADDSERSDDMSSNIATEVDPLKNPAATVASNSEGNSLTQPEFENDIRTTRGVKPAPPPPVESSASITQLGFRNDTRLFAPDDLPLIVEGPSLGETTSLKKANLERVALSGSAVLDDGQEAKSDWSIHDSAHADTNAETGEVKETKESCGISVISKTLSAAAEKAGSLLGFAGLGLMLAGLFLYRLALRNQH